MNDARRKEVHRAVALIDEAKGILETALAGEQNDLENMPEDLQDDEIGQTAEDAADSLERAVICCDDVPLMSFIKKSIFAQRNPKWPRTAPPIPISAAPSTMQKSRPQA